MDFTVDETYAERVLRDFLRRKLCVSHGLAAALKRENGIFADGVPVTVRHILSRGEKITLRVEDTESTVTPSDAPVRILYEDELLLACDKPPYMPTHESHGHRGDALSNALAGEFARRGVPFVFRAVNRLDADTSGVLLVAKNRYAAERLGALVRERRVEKTYIALLNGIPEQRSGTIESYIRRIGDSIILRASFPSGTPSEHAVTRYAVVETVGDIAVVRCTPLTGRTHQLRVHFASIGYPIVGDELYGGGRALPRQALHAAGFRFTHPLSGEEIEISSPLPADMRTFLDAKKTEFEIKE